MAGTTRSAGKVDLVRGVGAEPVVIDVYVAGRSAASRESNARMREEGTANLVHAARAAGASRFLAQSISE